jgi:hypothetical protein
MSHEKSFECPECGLHYNDEATTKQCEDFCKQYQACSIEITKNSIEAKEAAS